MKPFYLFVSATLGSHLAIQAQSATLVHSPLKNHTGVECGIKSYVQTQRRECGVDHFVSKQSPLCPAVRYNARTDASCPGSDAGGRVIRPVLLGGGSTGAMTIHWPADNLVHGGENIQAVVGNKVPLNGSGPFYSWSQGTTRWQCSASISRIGGGRGSPSYNGHMTCTTKAIVETCEKPEFGIAIEGVCALEEFGTVFKSCDDPAQVASYHTCQLRKTGPEIQAYIDATSSNIDLLAQQLATAQGNYILGAKQTKLASCLIERYESDILYEDIIQDLKNTFSAMFGLEYQPGQFDCTDSKETVEYTYQGKSCKNLSAAEISAKLAIPTLAANERHFYELCQQKATVDTLTDWFNFQVEEADLLLSDLIARSNPEVASKLNGFKNSLKKVNIEEIKCKDCRVTTVDTTKTPTGNPSVPPVPPVNETSEVIYNGESHPFSAGQGWDISTSTVEDATVAPASGQNHLRVTLNNQNYWGAAAYVVDSWKARDYSSYRKIRFKAKTNQATRVKLFFVSMDNGLESNHLEFNATTTWQTFEFDLTSAKTTDYDLSQVQGVVIAVSQPGKATYLVDLDDLELVGTK